MGITWPELSSLTPAYQVWLIDHNGENVELLENYETLEYVLATNGSGAVGWGSFRLTAGSSRLPHEEFRLDRIVSIRRRAPGQEWKVEFEGFHRRNEFWYDESDKEWYRSSGTDLKSLLKRRTTKPPVGEAFAIYEGAFTDVMRELVDMQAGPGAPMDQQLWHLFVEGDTGQGDHLKFATRDALVSTELEILTGLGAAFDIVRDGSSFTFRVYYPRLGRDLRQGHATHPVVFSIANGNMGSPSFVDDRLNEVNVVYVAGEGAGARREIVERTSVWDAMHDSPWNRIEGFLEASQHTSTAALMAAGDAFLTEMRRQISFRCTAIPTVLCLYGRDWNVGDLVTGIYRGVSYDLSVDQVEVSLDAERGEVITPTLRWLQEVV